MIRQSNLSKQPKVRDRIECTLFVKLSSRTVRAGWIDYPEDGEVEMPRFRRPAADFGKLEERAEALTEAARKGEAA